MISLRIEYLTGRCVATTYNDRLTAEWPPHPARVYYALVAAWADGGEDAEERDALEWLEAQPPPALAVDVAPARRAVMTHFVPVNDTAVLKASFGSLEEKVAVARVAADALEREVDAETHPKRRATLLARRDRAEAKSQQLERQLLSAKRSDQDELGEISGTATAAAARLLPGNRGRQPRTFPSAALADPVVHLLWHATAPPLVVASLGRLARRVTHIGHSSSLVACCLTDDAPPPSLVPHPSGALMLRVPTPGLLARLVAAHARHLQVEPRVMPCAFLSYAEPSENAATEVSASHFDDDWIVLRQVAGPRLSATLVTELAAALRGALMSHADQPVPALISGHEADGQPSTRPHLAFLALPWVGHIHASGDVLGMAMVLPRGADSAERAAVLRAVGRWEAAQRVELGEPELETPPLPLRLGARGIVEVERVAWGTAAQTSLQPRTWTRASRTWVTVTPIALDRNPGKLTSQDAAASAAAYLDAARTIATSCVRIGLPEPLRVDVLPSVTMPGVVKARYYPPFPSDGRKLRRVQVHAVIEFESPVRGPVLLGAGRFLGLGLCRPVDGASREER